MLEDSDRSWSHRGAQRADSRSRHLLEGRDDVSRWARILCRWRKCRWGWNSTAFCCSVGSFGSAFGRRLHLAPLSSTQRPIGMRAQSPLLMHDSLSGPSLQTGYGSCRQSCEKVICANFHTNKPLSPQNPRQTPLAAVELLKSYQLSPRRQHIHHEQGQGLLGLLRRSGHQLHFEVSSGESTLPLS